MGGAGLPEQLGVATAKQDGGQQQRHEGSQQPHGGDSTSMIDDTSTTRSTYLERNLWRDGGCQAFMAATCPLCTAQYYRCSGSESTCVSLRAVWLRLESDGLQPPQPPAPRAQSIQGANRMRNQGDPSIAWTHAVLACFKRSTPDVETLRRPFVRKAPVSSTYTRAAALLSTQFLVHR